MGMIACAGACAVSVNVLATDLPWFDGKGGTAGSETFATPKNASWNATLPAGVTLSASAVTLDNDSTSPLLLTPTANTEPALSDGVVTISATAVLTPSAVSDLVAIDDAKAGFAIGNDGENKAYYGYASGEGTSGEWIKLVGAELPATDETATQFKIVLDYRTGKKKNVKFFVGETQLYENSSNKTAFSIAEGATGLSDVAAYGSGSITALAASCEKAVAAVDTNGTIVKYGSVAEALQEQGSGTIKDVSSTGEAAAQPQAANGLYAWECDALNIAENATIPLTPAANDADANNVTLVVSGVTPDTGVSVTYSVYQDGVVEPVSTGNAASAIKIPVGTGKFTIKPVVTAAQ